MKIAIATSNLRTVARHYGTARFFEVLTVEGGQVVACEKRARPPGRGAAGRGRPTGEAAPGHGLETARIIADCTVLITGGIGRGAFDNLRRVGVETVPTDVRDVEEAVRRYLAGELPGRPDLLHPGHSADRGER
jgi:predicted Fe-Mo cluster-binding NifX family protein